MAEPFSYFPYDFDTIEMKERGMFLTSELLDRINVLAKKSREEGLTDEEKEEQAALRKQYIAEFRQGLMNTLEGVYIVDEQGNKKKVERKTKKGN